MNELLRLSDGGTYRLAHHRVAGQANAAGVDGCGHGHVEAGIEERVPAFPRYIY